MAEQYRKKPVVIEATRVPDLYVEDDQRSIVAYVDECVDLAAWCGGISQMMEPPEGVAYGIYIPTLEGEMRADPGDWIIKGVQGEFYPCKPDIFEATYEPVGADRG
jgi:hypothetical protein